MQRTPWLSVLSIPSLLVSGLIAGCADPSDPIDPPVDPPVEPPPPPAGTEITFEVFSPAEVARTGGTTHVAFVAYQDGDGAWQAMQGADGLYKARVQNQRFGVAVGCSTHKSPPSTNDSAAISVTHSTIGELKNVVDWACYVPGTLDRRTINGSVIGLGAGEQARAQFYTSNDVVPDAGGQFSTAIPKTRLQSFGVAWSGTGSARTPAKVVRGPEIVNGVGAVTLDFSQAVAPISMPITLPAGLTGVAVTATIRNNNELYASMRGTATEYRTLPASMLRAGDLIRVSATASLGDTATEHRYVFVIKHLAAPAPVTISHDAPLTSSPPTLIQRGSQKLPTYTFSSIVGTVPHMLYRVNASTVSGTLQTGLYANLSPGWIGGARAVSYPFPDLSDVPGWNASMKLASGEVDWGLSREDESTKDFVDGRTASIYGHSGVLTN